MNQKNIPIISSLFDRQEILLMSTGYYAPTYRELSEAFTISGIREVDGIAKHLQEIYRRQQNNNVNKPEKAIVSISKEYITNYRSAVSIVRQLGELALDINEIPNPKIVLAEEVEVIRSGHKAFIRYVDLKHAFSDERNHDEQQEVLGRSYFSNDLNTIDYIKKRLHDISVKDARKLITESLKDQNNRLEFWDETLRSLQSTRIAGPIINLAFKNQNAK